MQFRRLLLVLILGLLLIACSSGTIATQVLTQVSPIERQPIPDTGKIDFGNCGGPDILPINAPYEQAIIEQTNQIRMDHGLSPLKNNPQLDLSARYHAADMSSNNYFNHDTYRDVNGQMTLICDTWSRIEFYYPDWQALAENIAAGQRTPEMAMDGWMNSPDHRHNILSDNYSEIGVGYYEGPGEYRYYWDQNFGNRNGVFPLVINGEKAQTNQRDVQLYIYGKFESLRLRNDQGTWSSWMQFQNHITWQLPAQPGKHTVTAEMRGSDGNITSRDDIILKP